MTHKEDKECRDLKVRFNIHRSSIEIFALTFWVSATLLLLPNNAWQNLLALMVQKGLPVALGILTAHASRCFLFPYLDLSKLIEEHHWAGVAFLGAWYVGIILAWSWGG